MVRLRARFSSVTFGEVRAHGARTMMLSYAMATATLLATARGDGATASTMKPNILLFLTDDQDLELGSMGAMPFAREQLVEGGTRLSNFFAHTPVCCPSRSELLSGRYFQNIRVATAADKGCMRVNVTDTFHNRTLAVPLQAAGYTTGLFGKYLNGGGPKYLCPDANKTSGGEGKHAPFRPLGWDRFFGMCPVRAHTTNANLLQFGFQIPSEIDRWTVIARLPAWLN